ncbi:MAG: hypothetical protein ACHQF3_03790 [Alphaproteobacteria bacterium]
MLQHKFKVGQTVRFFPRVVALKPRHSDPASSPERFEVTRLLPAGDAGPQYRIKGSAKGQERVVTEREIG